MTLFLIPAFAMAYCLPDCYFLLISRVILDFFVIFFVLKAAHQSSQRIWLLDGASLMFMSYASDSRGFAHLLQICRHVQSCSDCKALGHLSELSLSFLLCLQQRISSVHLLLSSPNTSVSNQQSTNENSMVEINRRARRGVPVKQINISESPGKIPVIWGHTHFVLTKSPSLLQKIGFTAVLAWYSCPWPPDLSHHVSDASATDLS